MQVAIDLPNDFIKLRGHQQIVEELRLSYALRLFKASEVSLSKAAEVAGLNMYDFMSACKKEQIPVIDISKDELLEELAGVELQ